MHLHRVYSNRTNRVLMFAVALACLSLSSSRASAQNSNPQLLDVVLLGDSITLGIMSGPPGIPMGDLLAMGLAGTHEFTNIGCGGTSTPMWTISQGTNLCMGVNPETIFETFAIPNLPADFVTIMLGTNDSVGFFLPAIVTGPQYKTHMEEIIGNSLYFGARTVILMSPPPKCGPGTPSSPYLEAYRIAAYEICSEHPDVICGPDIYTLLDPSDFDSCNVHPNQQGHAKIARALGTSLVRHTPIAPEIQVFSWFVPSDPPDAPLLLPVVVYSEPDFEAVGGVDISTLTFGATGWEDSLLFAPQLGGNVCAAIDVDEDELPDLVCLFKQLPSGLTINSTEAWLRGRSEIGAALDSNYESPAFDLEPFPFHLVPDLEGLF